MEDKKTREFLLALAQELTKKSGDGLQERDTVTVMVGKNKYTVASPVMEKDKLMLSAADFDALLQRFFPDTAGQEVLPVAEWKKQVDKIIGLAGRNNPLNSVPLSKGIYFQDTITSAILYAKVIQPDGSYFVF